MWHNTVVGAAANRVQQALQNGVGDGYQEMPPPRGFASVVDCLWTSRCAQSVDLPVHPDGCVDIILRAPSALTGRLDSLAADVVGIMTGTRIVTVGSDDVYAGIRFRPGYAFRAIGPGAAPLHDRSVALDRLRPNVLQGAVAQAADAPPMDLLSLILSALWSDGDAASDDAQGAIDALARSHGRLPLSECLDIARMSERHFRRQCVERVGLAPKPLARLLRFRQVTERLRTQPALPMAVLALECGYSDQSHMVREVRRITGASPTGLQRH